MKQYALPKKGRKVPVRNTEIAHDQALSPGSDPDFEWSFDSRSKGTAHKSDSSNVKNPDGLCKRCGQKFAKIRPDEKYCKSTCEK